MERSFVEPALESQGFCGHLKWGFRSLQLLARCHDLSKLHPQHS